MSEHKPRLCHVVRGPTGYGFHLHGEKGKVGQQIRKVEEGSPAEHASLKEGDRIIEVNGKNVENEEHGEVVARIKEKSGETTLLVVDVAASAYFKEKDIAITEALINAQPDSSTMPAIEAQDKQLRPRLCHIVRGSDGFGFNLHSEKGKQGSYIKSVEKNGASDIAGMKAGDRVVEINGTNMEFEKHNALVAAIKGSGNKVDLLVVDEDTDKFFKEINVTPTVEHVSGPLPGRQGSSKPYSEVDPPIHSNLESAKASSNVPESSFPKDTSASKPLSAVVPPVEAALEPAKASAAASSPSQSNGVDLPNMDLATLKELSRSGRKKAAPQSNWNNRQAIFNNL